MTTPSPAITTLYEHTPRASEITGLRLCEQIVKLTKDPVEGVRVGVGWSSYTLEQARDLCATIMAAIHIGEQAGLWLAAGTTA